MGEDKNMNPQDPSKAAIEAGVKAAANAYAGPIGGKVAEAAMKTEAGQQLMNNGIQNMNNLSGMGKLPSTSSDSSQSSSSSSSGTDVSSGVEESDAVNPLDISSRFKGNSSSKSEGAFDLLNNKSIKKKIIIGATSVLAPILLFVLFIIILYGPIDSIKSFFQGTWNKVVDFFTKDVSELEEEYYQKLYDVRDNIKGTKNVCIDINMIQAALTVNQDFEKTLLEGNEVSEEPEDSGDSEEKKQYKMMIKNVEILANMQIKTITYGYDETLKSKDYCVPCDKSIDTIYTSGQLVDSTNQDAFKYDRTKYLFGDIGYDSSNTELISKHDMNNNWSQFFTKKSDEEKNYEFHFYIPYGTYGTEEVESNTKCYVSHKPSGDTYSTVSGMEEVDSCYCSNTCGDTEDPSNNNSTKKKTTTKKKCKCDNTLPEDSYEISIGNYKTRKESVFYWNLINSFVPEYYEEYLHNLTEEEKNKKIQEIADDIYLLYDEYGPDNTCGMQCSSFALGSNLCPNGIEVDGSLIPFEEYVAGVVAAENNWHQGDNIENLKAQAVAARTYAINRTNYCQSAIGNSSSSQNYKPTSDPYVIRAVTETSGIILTDASSKPVSAEYDASAVKEINSQGYVLNQQNQLIPYGVEETIGMASRHKTLCKKYAPNGLSSNSCHGRGMSQIGARYLQTQGYTYDQILKYYYGDVYLAATNDTVSGDKRISTLTMCTSVNGTSPDGVLTKGSCNPNSYYLTDKYWGSGLNSYYSTFVGECTWYAFGRSLKALVEDAGYDPKDAKELLRKTFLHSSNNGGQWYDNAVVAGTLRYGNDIDAITPGSIVSSSGTGSAGHVFFVEGVNYNTDGTVSELVVTERLGPIYCVYGTKKVTKNGSVTKVNSDTFYGFVSIINDSSVSFISGGKDEEK